MRPDQNGTSQGEVVMCSGNSFWAGEGKQELGDNPMHVHKNSSERLVRRKIQNIWEQSLCKGFLIGVQKSPNFSSGIFFFFFLRIL